MLPWAKKYSFSENFILYFLVGFDRMKIKKRERKITVGAPESANLSFGGILSEEANHKPCVGFCDVYGACILFQY